MPGGRVGQEKSPTRSSGLTEGNTRTCPDETNPVFVQSRMCESMKFADFKNSTNEAFAILADGRDWRAFWTRQTNPFLPFWQTEWCPGVMEWAEESRYHGEERPPACPDPAGDVRVVVDP